MSRVACTICGLEILPTTAERNKGLCGRCVKGWRPCVYCGQHVAEPLPNGVFAHLGCSIKHDQKQESLGWESLDDIDWQMIRQRLHGMLLRLFGRVVGAYIGAAPVKLRFFVQVQDFIEINVQDVLADGSAKRLSDPEWDRDLSPLDSSFSLLYEKLSEAQDYEASERVTERLTEILTDECKKLEKHNFSFPRSVPVSWVVQSD